MRPLAFTPFLIILSALYFTAAAKPSYAQVADVLNFFSTELDLNAGLEPQAPAVEQPQQAQQPQGASISEIFGAAPAAQVSTPVQSNVAPPLGPGAVQQSQAAQVPTFDPRDMEQRLKDEAFTQALQGMLPLNSEQIRRLLEEFDRTQESFELPVYPMPKPEFTVQTLSLDPGTKPLTVRAAQGHVTTLNMLDVTGAPWPIEDITWAGNFNIIQSAGGDGDDGVHFVRITPQSEFAYGNMSIKMLGLQTPIIMTIETSRDLVHYRFDAIVPEYGPFAEAPIIEGGVSLAAGNSTMSSVLQGIIPSGASRLTVNGADARTTAYRFGGQMYVRTPLTLLSPSWSSSVSSADGMRVYTIKQAPVLLLSDNGRMVRANVSLNEEALN